MGSTSSNPDQFEIDRQVTIRNRSKLTENGNLLYWYEQLYAHQFAAVDDPAGKRILEIGSGTSPLKRFFPNVTTSDLLGLEYLDLVFDCHEIDRVQEIEDASLDVITLTNVLHHLRDPVLFLSKAASKLKTGGRVIATEPEFSTLAAFIYDKIHHEPVDFDISEPKLADIQGPLASANVALPFLIFKKHAEWAKPLEQYYETPFGLRPFTGLSYMATGGISRRIPIPRIAFRPLFALDALVARAVPSLYASFFTVELVRR